MSLRRISWATFTTDVRDDTTTESESGQVELLIRPKAAVAKTPASARERVAKSRQGRLVRTIPVTRLRCPRRPGTMKRSSPSSPAPEASSPAGFLQGRSEIGTFTGEHADDIRDDASGAPSHPPGAERGQGHQRDTVRRAHLDADRAQADSSRQIGEEDSGLPVALGEQGAYDVGRGGDVQLLVRDQGYRARRHPPVDVRADPPPQQLRQLGGQFLGDLRRHSGVGDQHDPHHVRRSGRQEICHGLNPVEGGHARRFFARGPVVTPLYVAVERDRRLGFPRPPIRPGRGDRPTDGRVARRKTRRRP